MLSQWFARWAELNPAEAAQLRRTLLAHAGGGCLVYLPMPRPIGSAYRFPPDDQLTLPMEVASKS